MKTPTALARLFLRIWSFPKPTIAAVNGHAIAGGCGIATLCDFTMAVPEAKFGYPEVRIGFLPAVVSVFLMRQIGEKRARDLLLTGRTIDAAEAHRIGLVTQIVPAEELMTAAQMPCGNICSPRSPVSLHMTKKLLCDFAAPEIARELELAAAGSARDPLDAGFPRRPRVVPRKARSARMAGREPTSRTADRRHPPQLLNCSRAPFCYNFHVPMSEFIDTVVRVRYAETDKMGIVYYAQLFHLF